MHPFLENLKTQSTENPMLALAAGATIVAAATKFLGGVIGIRNSQVWAKEVSRRAAKDALKK